MNLHGVSKKLRHMGARSWGGCLTPSEAIEIISHGGIVSKEVKKAIAYQRSIGMSIPNWFYFEVKSKSKLEKFLQKKV